VVGRGGFGRFSVQEVAPGDAVCTENAICTENEPTGDHTP
jgi:hypothetical protein